MLVVYTIDNELEAERYSEWIFLLTRENTSRSLKEQVCGLYAILDILERTQGMNRK